MAYKSKAEAIRESLSLATARLRESVENSAGLKVPVCETGSRAEGASVDKYLDAAKEMQEHFHRINREMRGVEDLGEQWRFHIGSLTNPRHQKEEQEKFKQFTDAKNPNSYESAVRRANERLIVLEQQINVCFQEANRFRNRLRPAQEQQGEEQSVVTSQRAPAENKGQRLPLEQKGANLSAMVERERGMETPQFPAQCRLQSERHVRLPKLELPKFTGKAVEFLLWLDSFNAAVGLDERIHPAEKLQYLRGQLEGEPLKMVQTLRLADGDSYSIAMDRLVRRYGDKDVIINQLYSDMQNVDRSEMQNPASIRKVLEEMRAIVQQLDLLGEQVANNRLVIGQIKAKFPRNFLTALEKYKGGRHGPRWTSAMLLQAADDELYMIEEGTRASLPTRRPAEKKVREKQSHRALYAAVLDEEESEEETENEIRGAQADKTSSCKLCFSDDHWADDCNEYCSLDERRERIQSLDACFLCVKKHQMNSCTGRSTGCFHCTKAHASCICPTLFVENDYNGSDACDNSYEDDEKEQNGYDSDGSQK